MAHDTQARPDSSPGTRAGQILDDILRATEEDPEADQPTEFTSLRGICLTRRQVVAAVRGGIQRGMFHVSFPSHTLEEPIKVGVVTRAATSAQRELAMVLFDPTFFSTCTPEHVATYIQTEKIDPWSVTKRMFKAIAPQMVIE